MSYTCPWCGSTSVHPRDAQEKYCPSCHVFEDDVRLLKMIDDDEGNNDFELRFFGRTFEEKRPA